VRNVAGVSYVSGGVGEESRTSLQSQAAQFNVQVVFALKSGEYLADVDVAVRDASGRTLFSTVTDGPWLRDSRREATRSARRLMDGS
jgi:hypothetical protein